jgi:hypothetical protein
MEMTSFYQRVADIAACPPVERHLLLADLHTNVVTPYLGALGSITPEGAVRVVPDGRTVAQVVAHIAAWERYGIVATGELIAGVKWPRLMRHAGYLEPDGSAHDFPNDDAVNAFVSLTYANHPWAAIQDTALYTATALHRLWTQSGLLEPERLEQTRSFQGHKYPLMPCGWALWVIMIEHEGVEHVDDLALGRGA